MSCTYEVEAFYQAQTIDGDPTGLVTDLTLDALFNCTGTGNHELECVDVLTATEDLGMIPEETIGENVGVAGCLVVTAPPAESYLGETLEGAAGIEDTVTGGEAEYGPFTFVLTFNP